MGLAALAIKLEDGARSSFGRTLGPARPPHASLKFRTMITNANPAGVTVQATKGIRGSRAWAECSGYRLRRDPSTPEHLEGGDGFVGPPSPAHQRVQGRESQVSAGRKIPGFQERLPVQPWLTGIAQTTHPVMSHAVTSSIRPLLHRRQTFLLISALVLLSFWITSGEPGASGRKALTRGLRMGRGCAVPSRHVCPGGS